MVTRPFKTAICVIVLFLGCGSTLAQEKPGPDKTPGAVAVKDHEHPIFALTSLQRAYAADESGFVAQGELDPFIHPEGGGACASAVCVNLMQALRIMAGLEKYANPHKASLAAFKNQPGLLNGRVTNEQLERLILSYEAHVGPNKLKVEVMSAPNSGYRTHKPTWDEDVGPDLGVAPRQVKMLSYTVSEGTGKVHGRHFVLLKGQSDTGVEVVDPAKPGSERKYVLDYKAGEKGARSRLFLQNPAGIPRTGGYIYEVNTIFTVALVDDIGATARPSGVTDSVEYINQKLDETVEALRGKKEFLDPRAWRRKTAAFGLPGLDLPVEYGGSGPT